MLRYVCRLSWKKKSTSPSSMSSSGSTCLVALLDGSASARWISAGTRRPAWSASDPGARIDAVQDAGTVCLEGPEHESRAASIGNPGLHHRERTKPAAEDIEGGDQGRDPRGGQAAWASWSRAAPVCAGSARTPRSARGPPGVVRFWRRGRLPSPQFPRLRSAPRTEELDTDAAPARLRRGPRLRPQTGAGGAAGGGLREGSRWLACAGHVSGDTDQQYVTKSVGIT